MRPFPCHDELLAHLRQCVTHADVLETEGDWKLKATAPRGTRLPWRTVRVRSYDTTDLSTALTQAQRMADIGACAWDFFDHVCIEVTAEQVRGRFTHPGHLVRYQAFCSDKGGHSQRIPSACLH